MDNPHHGKHFKSPPEPNHPPKRRLGKGIIIAAVALSAIAAALAFFLMFKPKPEPEPEFITRTIIVPFHPGGTADLLAREFFGDWEIRNVHGTNGADGANEVYEQGQDGELVLFTTLSALQAAYEMGFSEHSPDDWHIREVEFVPSVVVVAADSPYTTFEELQAGSGLRCAVSSERYTTEFETVRYSGANPALHAVIDGEADFAIVLKTELQPFERSENVRGLETPESIAKIGEKYVLALPQNAPAEIFRGYESVWVDIRIE